MLDGIVKRLDTVLKPGELRRRLAASVEQETSANEATVPDLTARLRETDRKIARLVNVLAEGSDDMPSVRAAVAALERDRARLASGLAAAQERTGLKPAAEAAVEAMMAALAGLPDLLAWGDTEDWKRVVRTFLAGVKVDHRKGQATLRWYRLPRLAPRAAMSVEADGTDHDRTATDEEVIQLPAPRRRA